MDDVRGAEWGRSRDGVLDEGEDHRKGRGSFGGNCRASYRNHRGLCGVVILCREGWRRGSSHITLGGLVTVYDGAC